MLCVPPSINRKLRAAVESGEINVDNLIKMTGDERDALLQKYLGQNYYKTVSQRFVSRFNTELSDDVVKDIVDSLGKMNKLRAADTTPWNGTSKAWAREYVALQNRMEGVINKESNLGLIEGAKAFLKQEANKVGDAVGIENKLLQGVKSSFNILTSPIYKSLKASMDLSFALRQGFKVFTENPKQWGKSMQTAFESIKNIRSKAEMDAVMNEFKATYLAHPNYEKLVNEGKLAFGIVEDWFPTTIAEKVPALGNIFKSSNDAFTLFSQSARFGLANDLLEKQQQILGRELTKDELRSIGFIANSMTGRGSLGQLEASSKLINKIAFSGRYIRSQADTFLMPFNKNLTDFARKEARNHSLKTFAAIGGILATAKMMGVKVELDPHSSNFGKAKVPGSKAWIDLTAGLGSYISTVTKIISKKSKSATTGKTTRLNTGKYGGQDTMDVLVQWAEGKLSPAPSLIAQIYGHGELYGGKKPTPSNVARELLFPISASNVIDYLQNEDTATALLLSGLDITGAGVKTPY